MLGCYEGRRTRTKPSHFGSLDYASIADSVCQTPSLERLGKNIGRCQLVESVIRFYVWLSKWWYTISSTKKSVTNYSNNKALDLY